MRNTPETVEIIQEYLFRERATSKKRQITSSNILKIAGKDKQIGPVVHIPLTDMERDFHFVIYTDAVYRPPVKKTSAAQLGIYGGRYMVTLNDEGSDVADIFREGGVSVGTLAEIGDSAKPRLKLEERLIYHTSPDFVKKMMDRI